MAIKRTEYGWYSTVDGRTHESVEVAQHFEAEELARRNGAHVAAAEDKLKELSTEQLKALVESMQTVASEKEISSESLGKINVWLGTRPEYVNDERNKDLMVFHLKKAGQWPPYSVANIDDIFMELSDAGLLHLNKKALEKQQSAREQAQAEEILKQRNMTEAEMYALSPEELRRRADAQLRGAFITEPLNVTIGEL